MLEERNSAFSLIRVRDVDEFQRLYTERGQTNAIANGTPEGAQEEVVAHLTQLFYSALSDEVSVEYVWRKAPVEEAEWLADWRYAPTCLHLERTTRRCVAASETPAVLPHSKLLSPLREST